MAKVLVINSSMINKEKSYSEALLERFLHYYKLKNPNDEFINLDLNECAMAQKTLNRQNFNDGTYFSEEDSDKYIEQLKNVDKVIYTSPMTNFNIPAVGKNYLDHILVANKTFSYKYSKQGDAIGLLDHLKVQILVTQGAPYGWYLWGNHSEYLRGTWQFIGATVTTPILVDGTKIEENATLGIQGMIDVFDQRIQAAAQKF